MAWEHRQDSADADLTRDTSVQQRFPDGILWVTLGQQPNLLSLLTGWVDALGDHEFRPSTVQAASDRLSGLLHGKLACWSSMTPWHADHVQPFLVGGARCRVLITTRDALIANCGPRGLVRPGGHDPGAGAVLAEKRLNRRLEGAERQGKALATACAVGYLPAGPGTGRGPCGGRRPLGGAAHRPEGGDRPSGKSRRAWRGGANGRRRPQAPQPARLPRLSVKGCPTDGGMRSPWLGVLPDDAVLTPAATATLWKLA